MQGVTAMLGRQYPNGGKHRRKRLLSRDAQGCIWRRFLTHESGLAGGFMVVLDIVKSPGHQVHVVFFCLG